MKGAEFLERNLRASEKYEQTTSKKEEKFPVDRSTTSWGLTSVLGKIHSLLLENNED
jgi:hypothetical protein